MKAAIFILMASVTALGQSSSVTATLTDSDSQTWNNGSWTATIYSPNGTPTISGTPLTAAQKSLSGTLSSSGVLTGTFSDNSFISPTGSLWRFTLCPNASAACSSGLVSVTGATPNLSTAISALLIAPRFAASPSAYGYLDVEVSPTPIPGGVYYNVTTPAWRQWNGSAWTTVGSGSGAPVTCVAGTYACTGLANTFTAVQTVNPGASGNGILQTSSATDGTYNRYANTSASLLNWKAGVAGSAFSLSGVYAIVDDTNSTGEFGIHSTGVGTGQILLGANMSIGFANNPDVRSAGGFNGLMSSDGSKWTFTLPLATPSVNLNFTTSPLQTVASASTVTPTSEMVTISGTGSIDTITLPANFSSTVGGCLDILATGAWSTTTAGNIQAVVVAVANTSYRACYFGTKWFIK